MKEAGEKNLKTKKKQSSIYLQVGDCPHQRKEDYQSQSM